MVLMTQIGYLDNINPWSGSNETLEQITDAMETGGSSSSNSNLTASVEGADLIIDEPMTNITFQYNASAASGSGSGSSSSSAFAYANDQVDTGDEHTCAILSNGDVKCWGRDNYGQLGDGGSSQDINAPPSTAIDLGTGRTAVAISAGTNSNCAILDNGDLKCWGNNYFGALVFVVLPSPNCPLLLRPQHFRSPLSRIAQVCSNPADTATAVRPVPRSIAVDEGALMSWLLPPLPNCP